QILSKRTKNNPVLIGDPGVGKTAIVEGLAQLIASGDVPKPLKDNRLISLDLAGLVAGTKFRGEFEDRLKRVMREIMTSDQKIVLFIDELHTIIGAGAAEGAIDAANILKPALARGELRAIGATTTAEFKKHVERHGALERRFQPVMVNEPTVEQTIAILKGLRKKYEEFHFVEISDEAIEAAAKFSHRFVTSRSLPDKAIDLMDEAGAKVHVGLTLKQVGEGDVQPAEKAGGRNGGMLEEDDELPEPIEGFGDEEETEEEERELPEGIKRDLETSTTVRGGDLKLQKVSAEDIAEVVHAWTGIPVTAIAEEETEKLLRIEEWLHKRLVGQDEAIGAIARALRRSRVGLKDPKRPTGSFLFAGPTGVGKTELAKALAEFLFGDESALIRFDMSEYMEKFSVSRLVGAPPGYVGYDEGGQLTEAVKRRPYSVVLMDEIEKAHPEVFNILLQVMEDGIITDSQGRTIDLKNIILILTSNLGTGDIGMDAELGFRAKKSDEKDPIGFDPEKIARQYTPKVQESLKKSFRPEFLNRLDEVVVFKPLAFQQIVLILENFLARVQVALNQYGLTLEYTEEAKLKLVEEGFSKTQGARPLRRTVQRRIEDPLSEYILRHDFEKGDTVQVSWKDGAFAFDKVRKEVAAV
ncbi:MAG: ATP-dependent Clp protease ATP-binding subunit, partial [bacterium]